MDASNPLERPAAGRASGRDVVREGLRDRMPDWALLLIFLVGWVVLQRWVLPRFGVPT